MWPKQNVSYVFKKHLTHSVILVLLRELADDKVTRVYPLLQGY